MKYRFMDFVIPNVLEIHFYYKSIAAFLVGFSSFSIKNIFLKTRQDQKNQNLFFSLSVYPMPITVLKLDLLNAHVNHRVPYNLSWSGLRDTKNCTL